MDKDLNFTAQELKPLSFCDKNIGFEFTGLFILPKKQNPQQEQNTIIIIVKVAKSPILQFL
jgi:hypothetical protein